MKVAYERCNTVSLDPWLRLSIRSHAMQYSLPQSISMTETKSPRAFASTSAAAAAAYTVAAAAVDDDAATQFRSRAHIMTAEK